LQEENLIDNTRKSVSKIKPLLTLYGVELFNTGPDLNVFLPTLIAFVVLLSAASYIIHILPSSNNFMKKLAIYVNLFQNISYLLVGLVNPGVAKVNER
jgi:hypothetical protein